jgi:alkylated DNA repair dioxygenase AlkB
VQSLFEEPADPVIFALPDAEVIYYPRFLGSDADDLFRRLLEETPWQQDNITLFGKTHPQPRLTALYGNEGKLYSYSNIIMQPHPWTPLLTYIREKVGEVCDARFTTVLLNQYRNGQDSNGWHADNEKELGRDPLIASLSFGATRSFHLKHNESKQLVKLELTHGSLLVMRGPTQHFWKHQIPKTSKPVGNRINLTFRIIK